MLDFLLILQILPSSKLRGTLPLPLAPTKIELKLTEKNDLGKEHLKVTNKWHPWVPNGTPFRPKST